MNKTRIIPFFMAAFAAAACTAPAVDPAEQTEAAALKFPDILDIRHTPGSYSYCNGWFTDEGSWYGFTPPEDNNQTKGFCGPFDLDMYRREWISDAVVKVSYKGEENAETSDFTSCYYPGQLRLSYSTASGNISQSLCYIDASTVLLSVEADAEKGLTFSGKLSDGWSVSSENGAAVCKSSGERAVTVNFPEGTEVKAAGNSYSAEYSGNVKRSAVVIRFTTQGKSAESTEKAASVLVDADKYRNRATERWNGYLDKILKKDMPAEYDRIAVKAVVTLMANSKKSRGDIRHEGVVPSQGVDYFMGFWGWDSWKHAAALSLFNPQLAKNQVRAMFDYQTPEGMVIDCIYSNKSDNNARNSKPPLAAWAVNMIYKQTGDIAFVKEIFPKLALYHKWWYGYRDHDHNGFCEYGACDGTLQAAAWESGMDNAVRFDDARMVRNENDAWSMDRESVDLNAFLALESTLLTELAKTAGIDYTPEGASAEKTADRFYFDDRGFFFDRRLDGSFVLEEGTEACIPLWAGIASKKQAEAASLIFTDPSKFATYIPFPTVAADNPKFSPNGYWRGPIWLDQVYFGISGLRRYGFTEQADEFTRNVFDRLYKVSGDAPIYENYDTGTGGPLQAPHFSWSAAHLLLLYETYKTENNLF